MHVVVVLYFSHSCCCCCCWQSKEKSVDTPLYKVYSVCCVVITMAEFEDKAGEKKTSDATVDINLVEIITSGANARGIPSAVFIVSSCCHYHSI